MFTLDLYDSRPQPYTLFLQDPFYYCPPSKTRFVSFSISSKILYVFLVSLADYTPISSFALRFDQRQVFKRVRFMTCLINFVLHTLK